MRCLSTTLAILDACSVPDRGTVSVRLKRLDSIRRKIGRAGNNFALGRLDDVVGVRVVCENLREVNEFSARIQRSPAFYRAKDYISSPAETGYRGINHIMRFEQPVTADATISMRFEVQVRTYLQHRWAVWSEFHGEAAKLGVGHAEVKRKLRALSEDIARWEGAHPGVTPEALPPYLGGRSIAVCWRAAHGPVAPYFFQNESQRAVEWLNYLETTYPNERQNALLLVGVTRPSEAHRLLRLTHPLFMGARLVEPKYWVPP